LGGEMILNIGFIRWNICLIRGLRIAFIVVKA